MKPEHGQQEGPSLESCFISKAMSMRREAVHLQQKRNPIKAVRSEPEPFLSVCVREIRCYVQRRTKRVLHNPSAKRLTLAPNYLHIENYPLKSDIHRIMFKDSQEIHYVTAKRTNRLMLFGETVAVYCENHTEHTHTLCG
jgi:hypothetical protein